MAMRRVADAEIASGRVRALTPLLLFLEEPQTLAIDFIFIIWPSRHIAAKVATWI